MKGNTKKGSVWGGTKVMVVSILTLVFGFALVGCDDGGGDDRKVERLISGFIKGTPRNVTSSVYGRSASLDILMARTLPEDVSDEPFVLEMDTGLSAPSGMTGLKGRVQADGDSGKVVIELKGLLDNASGKFVAAGIAEDLGVGFQIEGYYKGKELSGVKVTVKVRDPDTREWDEMELSPANEDAAVSATTSTKQTGLPSNWSGRYNVPEGAIGFDEDDDNVLFNSIREHVFFVITPEGLSTGADKSQIEAYIKNHGGNTARFESFYNDLVARLPTLAFSFLEIEKKSEDTYWVLAFLKDPQEGGSVIVETFVKLRLVRGTDGNITLTLAGSGDTPTTSETAQPIRALETFVNESFHLTKKQ
ncbi:MAG: hypothetical protein LBG74_01635 [Spirochaetaceae bacterium]|jgi:hypothetical protein|nr:hypothetical protein [Spirochaetaceae bacterium]